MMAAEVDPAPARDAVSSASADDGALVIDLARQRPAPSAPAPTPARAALASAIASVTSASAALERAEQPVSRLRSLIATHDSLTRKLADLRAVEEERLTAWLIGSAGPRPAPAPEDGGVSGLSPCLLRCRPPLWHAARYQAALAEHPDRAPRFAAVAGAWPGWQAAAEWPDTGRSSRSLPGITGLMLRGIFAPSHRLHICGIM
jgi:hypothetical protein